MRSRIFLFKTLVFFVLLVVLTARIGAFSHRCFVVPIQDFLSQKAHIADEGSDPKSVFFKTKSLSENFPLPAGDDLLPARFHIVSFRRLLWVPRPPEDIWLDIFIPPENLS